VVQKLVDMKLNNKFIPHWMHHFLLILTALNFQCSTLRVHSEKDIPTNSLIKKRLEWIQIHTDGTHFVRHQSQSKFCIWGVNYDHDRLGRLIEDYWNAEWQIVVDDFKEIKELGANVVRIHLQLGKFMETSKEANISELNQLVRLVSLAEETELYLDITGLGCYYKQDVPEWYDSMSEAQRWEVQGEFWQAVARTCAQSPAIFCYDLMNEPILAGKTTEESWLGGELAGKYFVQRITRNLAGRTREQVAKAWVDTLVTAIKKHDQRHLITVGVIPWAHTWPNAKPIFYAQEVSENIDFTSVHFYPEKGGVEKALKALKVYDIGKPLVIEEMFSLKCGVDEMNTFIEGSKPIVDGWISFYWGKTIEEYAHNNKDIASQITKQWLEYFKAKSPEILQSKN
jgi:hypothetical protein